MNNPAKWLDCLDWSWLLEFSCQLRSERSNSNVNVEVCGIPLLCVWESRTRVNSDDSKELVTCELSVDSGGVD